MDPSKSGFGANQEGSKINQLPINYEMLHQKNAHPIYINHKIYNNIFKLKMLGFTWKHFYFMLVNALGFMSALP